MAPVLAASFLVVHDVADTTTITTASFTPNVGDVIVVKASSESNALVAALPSDTAGNTYASILTDATASHCYARLSGSTVTISASMTVSTTFSGTSGWHSMIVERWTGATLAGTPATNGTKTGSGAPSSTIATTAANSAVSWLNADFNAISPAGRTYNTTSATPVDDGIDDGSTTHYVAYYAHQAAATAGTQTFGITAPTGQAWTLLAVEILASGGGGGPGDAGPQTVPMFLPTLSYSGDDASSPTATVFPMRPWQRRFQWVTQPWLNSNDVAPAAPTVPVFLSDPPRPRTRPMVVARRSRMASPPFVQLAPVPPAWMSPSARPRGLLVRRSDVVSPPWVQASPPAAPAYVQNPGRHAARTAPARRGRLAPAPAPQMTVAAPTRPRRAAPQRRRTVPATVVPPQIAPPPSIARARRVWPWRRRPIPAVPVPAQVAAPAAPQYPTTAQRPRRTMTGARRATTPMPVPAQATAAPPPAYPVWVFRVHRTVTGQRRSKAVGPVPPQAAAIPPPPYPAWVFRTHRIVTGLRRSGAPAPVPPQATAPAAPTYVPQLRARRALTLPRRGRTVTPVPPQAAAPAPPVYVPQLRAARRALSIPRRGRSATAAPAQLEPPPKATQRRAVSRPRRRGATAVPVPPQIVVAPPSYPRVPVRHRILALLLRRPGRLRFPIQPGSPAVQIPKAPLLAPGTRSSAGGAPGTRASSSGIPGTHTEPAGEPGTRGGAAIEPGTKSSPSIEGGA